MNTLTAFLTAIGKAIVNVLRGMTKEEVKDVAEKTVIFEGARIDSWRDRWKRKRDARKEKRLASREQRRIRRGKRGK